MSRCWRRPGAHRRRPTTEQSLVEKLIPDFLWISTEYTAKLSLDGLERNKMRVVPGVTSKAMSVASGYAPRAIVARSSARSTGSSAAASPLRITAASRGAGAEDAAGDLPADDRPAERIALLKAGLFIIFRGSRARRPSAPGLPSAVAHPAAAAEAAEGQRAPEQAAQPGVQPLVGRLAVDRLAVLGLQRAGPGGGRDRIRADGVHQRTRRAHPRPRHRRRRALLRQHGDDRLADAQRRQRLLQVVDSVLG